MLNCTAQKTKSSFDEFSSKFSEITFPFQISDSLAFYNDNWNSEDYISFDDIVKYDLVTKYASKDYPLEIHQFECSRVGKYKMENYIVILYKAYTTMAGRGNPYIFLATFTEKGEKIDERIALWDAPWDPLDSERYTLFMPNNSTFVIKSIHRTNGLLKDELVLKRVTERIINYEITKDGTIVRRDDTVKVLFEDNNPDILDDFPEY